MNHIGNQNENPPFGEEPDTGGENEANCDAVTEDFKKALDECRAEAEKFKNEYLYLRAEFENYKKQTIKDRSELRKYGSERLLADLLNVVDIFESALSSDVTIENISDYCKGIELTSSELKAVLKRHGVEELPAMGEPFDPSHHEALNSEETDKTPPGTITQVFKKPYKLFDRVIRPGQVVVAKSVSKTD